MDRERTGARRQRKPPAPSSVRGAARAEQVLQRAVATEAEILAAALLAMSDKGYHATSVREIADQAGMSVANLYHYFASKQAILFRLMDENVQLLIDQLEEAIAAAPPEPREQLLNATVAFATMHTTRRQLAFVTSTELRALDPEARDTVVQKRRRIEELFVAIIDAGKHDGAFRVDDVELSTRMLLDMTRSLAAWYRPDGRVGPDEIVRAYGRAALVLMGGETSNRDRQQPRKRAPRRQQ